MEASRYCPKCDNYLPLTDEFFYPSRPTATHPNGGWQSYCKLCWKRINRMNHERIAAQQRFKRALTYRLKERHP